MQIPTGHTILHKCIFTRKINSKELNTIWLPMTSEMHWAQCDKTGKLLSKTWKYFVKSTSIFYLDISQFHGKLPKKRGKKVRKEQEIYSHFKNLKIFREINLYISQYSKLVNFTENCQKKRKKNKVMIKVRNFSHCGINWKYLNWNSKTISPLAPSKHWIADTKTAKISNLVTMMIAQGELALSKGLLSS